MDAQPPQHAAAANVGDRFVILHLSDIHLGDPAFDLNAPLVVEPLYKDLAYMRGEHGLVPDLIVFNCDLAQGELAARSLRVQYGQAAKRFLDQVCGVFGRDLTTQRILVVPGNHDIDRTAIAQAQTEWLRRVEVMPDGAEVIYAAMRDGARDCSCHGCPIRATHPSFRFEKGNGDRPACIYQRVRSH